VIPAYVGIGSNQGDARAHVLAAFDELAQLPATHLAARSSLYRSAPVDAPGQADYVNAVAALDTELSPAQLLDALQGIERRHGRERPYPNAPRTLDLDLLTYGDMILTSPMLTLPHPRMHERAFVLRPLLELDARAEVPGRGRAAALLAACADQRVERLD
jgi:2-amino-4-hydroxy-6-hydroxymethyldihydropteridine diphosphokinase